MTGCDLTRRAQNALRLARESSAQLGHGYVGSEHLLLGLLRERRGTAARALQAAGIQETAVRDAIAGLVGVGARGCGPSQGLTPRCRRIVELAASESTRLGSRYVDTEHLLIGILREGVYFYCYGPQYETPAEIRAARILGGIGADLRKLYRGLYASLGDHSGSAPYRGRAKEYDPPRESRLLEQFTRDLTRMAAACIKIQGDALPECCSELEARRRETIAALEEAIRGQDFERAALLRDAEVNFRRQLEEAHQDWRDNREQTALSVDAEDIAQVLSRWTGIPVTALTEDEASRLLRLEETLHRRVIGQESAVQSVAAAIRRSRTGLQEENRPVGSFLFAGPSGVGKTELCRSLAEALFGSENALLRLDMSEYMEAQSVSRLIGSPPGYVGYEEGGRLTEEIRKRPYRVVLFDELEKAHQDVWNLLLQILEDGTLTDSHGHKADFRNAVLIMTTNAGAQALASAEHPLGFSPGGRQNTDRALHQALRQVFRPEFLNRVDEIICFQSLSDDEILRIAQLMLDRSLQRLQAQGITVQYTSAALEVVAQFGHDPAYGVRPMRRYLRRELENPAAELLLQGTLCRGSTLSVDAAEEHLTLLPAAPLPILLEAE